MFLSFVNSNISRAILSVIAGLIVGSCRASKSVRDQDTVISYIGREAIVSAIVADIPETKNSQTRLKLNNVFINYSTNALKSQIYATLSGEYDNISRSDRISLRAKIQAGFGDYVASIYHPIIMAIDKPDPPDYFAYFRSNFTERIRTQLHQSVAADLALGFLVGEKTLPEKLKEQLRTVGLSHVVVASGFCLSILINFARKLTRKVSRSVSYIFALILMAGFLLITGLSPSLLRASLISSLILVADYYGRKFHPGRLIVYATAISALVNPPIITNLAWQLSMASYVGIMFLTPVLKMYFYGNRKMSSIAEMVFVTISAQLFCLPISLYYFGQISIVGLLANILVTPVTSTVMLLTFLSGIAPTILAKLLVIPNNAILSYQILVIEQLGKIKWASFNIDSSQPVVFALYIPIIAFLWLLIRRTQYSYRPVLSLDKSPKYGKIYTC